MKSCTYLLFITSLLVSGCDIRVLNPQSDTAEAQSNLIYFSFLLMLLVLIIVFVMMFRFVSKYREEKVSYEIPKQEEGNRKLELTWTILPVLLLIILAVPTVIVTFNQSPNGDVQDGQYKDAVHIEVTAKRYEWQFTYQNGMKTVNELYLPAEETVVFHLRSEDVIHSFWVPSLGGKVDVRPDQENTLVLTNMKPGSYRGKCAEYCGTNHTLMTFTTEVMPEDEFQNFAESS